MDEPIISTRGLGCQTGDRYLIKNIKLDIEGSEMCALEGARQIIERDHPKLAVCLYHKLEDLWTIPLWIKERFREYKFYIRHHSLMSEETVLYAIWNK